VSEADKRRPIRSFVRREGRMTVAQKRALEELWPRFGIDPDEAPINFSAAFGRDAPVVLEIGFGNGNALATLAVQQPQNNYLGIEVHRPGVGHLLRRLHDENLANVRVLCADAQGVLTRNIPDASLAAVYLLFPDPWPKQRHHKRRLVQSEFIELVRHKLKLRGVLHLATDWQDYAEHMRTVLAASSGFAPAPADTRPVTKYEARGQRLGHPVCDLVFTRVD
jgi:tRNA (guanine-N7-)-methyltransferase